MNAQQPGFASADSYNRSLLSYSAEVLQNSGFQSINELALSIAAMLSSNSILAADAARLQTLFPNATFISIVTHLGMQDVFIETHNLLAGGTALQTTVMRRTQRPLPTPEQRKDSLVSDYTSCTPHAGPTPEPTGKDTYSAIKAGLLRLSARRSIDTSCEPGASEDVRPTNVDRSGRFALLENVAVMVASEALQTNKPVMITGRSQTQLSPDAAPGQRPLQDRLPSSSTQSTLESHWCPVLLGVPCPHHSHLCNAFNASASCGPALGTTTPSSCIVVQCSNSEPAQNRKLLAKLMVLSNLLGPLLHKQLPVYQHTTSEPTSALHFPVALYNPAASPLVPLQQHIHQTPTLDIISPFKKARVVLPEAVPPCPPPTSVPLQFLHYLSRDSTTTSWRNNSTPTGPKGPSLPSTNGAVADAHGQSLEGGGLFPGPVVGPAVRNGGPTAAAASEAVGAVGAAAANGETPYQTLGELRRLIRTPTSLQRQPERQGGPQSMAHASAQQPDHAKQRQHQTNANLSISSGGGSLTPTQPDAVPKFIDLPTSLLQQHSLALIDALRQASGGGLPSVSSCESAQCTRQYSATQQQQQSYKVPHAGSSSIMDIPHGMPQATDKDPQVGATIPGNLNTTYKAEAPTSHISPLPGALNSMDVQSTNGLPLGPSRDQVLGHAAEPVGVNQTPDSDQAGQDGQGRQRLLIELLQQLSKG